MSVYLLPSAGCCCSVLENGSPVLLVVCDTDIIYSGALIFILFMTEMLINSMEMIWRLDYMQLHYFIAQIPHSQWKWRFPPPSSSVSWLWTYVTGMIPLVV